MELVRPEYCSMLPIPTQQKYPLLRASRQRCCLLFWTVTEGCGTTSVSYSAVRLELPGSFRSITSARCARQVEVLPHSRFPRAEWSRHTQSQSLPSRQV